MGVGGGGGGRYRGGGGGGGGRYRGGGGGANLSGKKRYVTLEWPLTDDSSGAAKQVVVRSTFQYISIRNIGYFFK